MDPISFENDKNLQEPEGGLAPTVVAHFSTLNEAQMVVSLLGSFGIAATIDSENYHRMLGSMIPTSGGVPVEVEERDREAALEILAGAEDSASRETTGEKAGGDDAEA